MTQTAQQARLADWYRDWRVPIRRWLCYRCSVPSKDLDDLTQEVFVRMLRYSDDDLVENPQSYLFRIAINIANEWRERCVNRQPHSQIENEDIEEEHHFELAFLRDERILEIQRCVAQLRARQVTILKMHIEDGLTYQQIADRLGLTYRIVLRDLTNAYAQLRKDLGEWR